MLWTDNYFVTSDDLNSIDSEVSDVAGDMNIVVDGANGIIQRTIEETGSALLAQMQRFGGYLSSGLVTANHLAAVFNVGGPGVNRVRVLLDQVVAYNPQLPQTLAVKQWVCYRALYNFFRAASVRVNEDRFEKRKRMYQEDTIHVYWPNLQNLGCPIVYRPMQAPGAAFDMNAGTWGSSNVTTVSQAGTSGGKYDVAITYVDQAYYKNAANKYNSEGYTSARITVTVNPGQALSVNLNGLIPPNAGANAANLPQAITTPLNATGWNVYVGETGGTLYLQNTSGPITMPPLGSTTYYGNSGYANTIPLSNTTPYVFTADPVLSGIASDYGQFADAYYTLQDQLQRG